VKNTSGLHLMRGPVTVFEGGSYAGDAHILDLQPNEERLLSYAVDLGTEVKPEAAADGGRLTQVKVVKGVLSTTTKLRETKTHTVKNRNPQGRAVLIEHPGRRAALPPRGTAEQVPAPRQRARTRRHVSLLILQKLLQAHACARDVGAALRWSSARALPGYAGGVVAVSSPGRVVKMDDPITVV
jgi:hypothetical protein